MADEISALEKHACPACGAQAEWNPTKQKLVCPFCGTESPYAIDRATGKVVEVDLVAALRDLPADERGWQTATRSVQCQSCKAVMVFAGDRVGQNCEFCGSPALVSYDEIKAPIRPHGVLPFRVDTARVRDDIRRWWRSKWLAPNKLSKTSLVDTVHGLYIPYWTFDAQVHCPWDAEAGHYYYVTVAGPRQQGPQRHATGASGPLGSGVRRRRSLLRRRAGPGDARAAARTAAPGRAVPDAGSRFL